MILKIFIDKLQDGVYETHSTVDRYEVDQSAVYESIADAIRAESLGVPEGLFHFVEFSYAGLSTETLRPTEAAEKADTLARRFLSLLSDLPAAIASPSFTRAIQ